MGKDITAICIEEIYRKFNLRVAAMPNTRVEEEDGNWRSQLQPLNYEYESGTGILLLKPTGDFFTYSTPGQTDRSFSVDVSEIMTTLALILFNGDLYNLIVNTINVEMQRRQAEYAATQTTLDDN